MQNFSEYLYGGVLGHTKLNEFRLDATGEITRIDLTTMALRALYYISIIQHKTNVRNDEEIAKQNEADRIYVSRCEKELLSMGENQIILHELKILAPRALIYLYLSKSIRD